MISSDFHVLFSFSNSVLFKLIVKAFHFIHSVVMVSYSFSGYDLLFIQWSWSLIHSVIMFSVVNSFMTLLESFWINSA